MSKQNRIETANDNAPSPEPETGTWQNSDFNAAEITQITDNHIPLAPDNHTQSSKNNSLKLSVLLWLVSIGIGLMCIFSQTSIEVKSFSALMVLWTGVWTSYVAADHNHWRLSELAIVGALGGMMGAVTIASDYFGLNLTLIDGIILMSVLALTMGYALKSRIAILASICAALLWAMMSFIGLTPINEMAGLFPVLIALQIYSGTRINSGLPITLATFTGYFGLIGLLSTLWIDNLIPVSFAASLLFIIGAAHHRLGKAAADSKMVGSNVHIFTGWIAAIVSVITFQYLWLSPDAALSSEAVLSASGLSYWKIGVSLSILAIFISGIVRFKHTQITLPGIFLLTICSALIPLMMWIPSGPERLAAAIPGVTAIPAIGIIIGASIIAAGLGFAINGVRRGSRLMLLLGVSVLGIETFLLMSPSLMTVDNIIVFIASLVTALAIGGAIAGNSLAFQAPAPRLKHA